MIFFFNFNIKKNMFFLKYSEKKNVHAFNKKYKKK